MSHDHSTLITQLKESLTQQRYNASLVSNYCHNADSFLCYLDRRKIAVEAARPMDVSNYLRCAVRWFRQRHGHLPRPNGSPDQGHQSVRCCGSCKSNGHLSLWHPIPARSSAKRYATSTENG